MSYESDDYGVKVDAAQWKVNSENVMHRLAGDLSEATGLPLRERHSDMRGGVYYRGEEKEEGKSRLTLMLVPNYVPADDDWIELDHKEYAVLIELFGYSSKRVAVFRKAITESVSLNAILLRRTIGDEDGRDRVLFSLKNEADGESR